MFSRTAAAAFLLLLACLTTLASAASLEYSAFVNHFSSNDSSHEVAMAHSIQSLHPNLTFVVTKLSPLQFNLQSFAANYAENQAKLTKVAGAHSLSRKVYYPSERRRDGPGIVGDDVVFGEFDLVWKDTMEFKVYVTTWFSPYYGPTVQSHFVTNEPESTVNDLILAVSSYTQDIREAILVFDQSRWMPDKELWKSVQKASWDDVILNETLKTIVKHEYEAFFAAEEIYRDLGVAWKRGIIFLGPPGNGKTISLKAIMKASGVPTLYVKSFHTYNGDELGIRMIFERARAEAPCLLVMEDLDSLVTDQNRSFFLNELDGLEGNDGLLLIGTTNHFDRLDPALSNRPSRFDRKLDFPDPSTNERRLYCVYWQKKLSKNKLVEFPDALLDEVAQKTEGFSFAYLKEAFVAALLTLASSDSPNPPPFKEVLFEQITWLKDQIPKDSVNGLNADGEHLPEAMLAVDSTVPFSGGLREEREVEALIGQRGRNGGSVGLAGRPVGVVMEAQHHPVGSRIRDGKFVGTGGRYVISDSNEGVGMIVQE